jgi:hypothetical protein
VLGASGENWGGLGDALASHGCIVEGEQQIIGQYIYIMLKFDTIFDTI